VFNPIEFAVLARQLAAGSLDVTFEGAGTSHECRLRAALGRAYYTLYLTTRAVIIRKHGIAPRRLSHGVLYTYLQHSTAGREVQLLGQELARLYTLRQKADYELLPTPEWHRKLTDVRYVDLMAKQAIASASVLDRLDFGPVAELLSR
jgi:uncharacterized protein (UPF0332 family)